MMREKRRVLFLLLNVVLLVCLASAQEAKPSKYQMRASKLASNVYMIESAGGNIGASVGDDGIVMIDDEVEPLVEQTLAALKGISNKAVKFIINTHYHDDHTGGNGYFQKLAPIIAHDNVRRRLESGGISGNGGSMHEEVKPAATEALPTFTFNDEITLHLNGEDICVIHYPSAHTDGDAIVFFRRANVVHMGDIFVTYGFPFVDIDSGGNIDGMIDAVEKVIAQSPPDVTIIPGHGPVSKLGDLRSYLLMLKETRNVVAKALRDGKTLDQLRQAKILDPWKKYSGDFVSEDAFLETLYNSLHNKKQRDAAQKVGMHTKALSSAP